MRELSPGWATDIAVLELSGSVVQDQGDYLVVRTPDNPGYHWGNCLFVTDDQSVEDAARWTAVFSETFPEATWVSIGLIQMPAASAAWDALGIALELDEVLTTSQLPHQTTPPVGYEVRRLDGDDWEQLVQREVAENARTGEYEPAGHEVFVRAQTRTRAGLADRGVAAFFGAFSDGRLVAELGIVPCGATARYQAVGTDPTHRRRGLATHLLGVAGVWAAERDCDRWVIVTESTNPAGRVYRKAGFEPGQPNAQAYRQPPR